MNQNEVDEYFYEYYRGENNYLIEETGLINVVHNNMISFGIFIKQ